VAFCGILSPGADPGICVRGALSLLIPFPPVLPSLTLPLEVGPLFCGRGSGGALNSPSGSERSPAAKRFLVNCRLKIVPVVAMVTKDTSTWSIAKSAIRYLLRQSQHNMIYCAMGPKSFSAVMARKTTSGAEWKTHQKQYISGASGGFFQVVEVVQKQRYFIFVISASHCQQLGLYSKCYTVCDFTLH